MRMIVTDQQWAPVLLQWMAERIGVEGDWNINDCRVIAHVDVTEGKPVGPEDVLCVVALNHWTPHTCEGNIASSGSARWMSRDFAYTVYDFAFNFAGKARINFTVSPDNKPAIAMHAKLGHKYEALLADAGGDGHDMLLYGFTKSMWQQSRWSKPSPKAINTSHKREPING